MAALFFGALSCSKQNEDDTNFIAGRATQGGKILKGATVEIYQLSNSTQSSGRGITSISLNQGYSLTSTCTTSVAGKYLCDIGDSGSFKVVVSGGTFADGVNNSKLLQAFVLDSTPAGGKNAKSGYVNDLTSLAVSIAEKKFSNGPLTVEKIQSAETAVKDIFGFKLNATQSLSDVPINSLEDNSSMPSDDASLSSLSDKAATVAKALTEVEASGYDLAQDATDGALTADLVDAINSAIARAADDYDSVDPFNVRETVAFVGDVSLTSDPTFTGAADSGLGLTVEMTAPGAEAFRVKISTGSCDSPATVLVEETVSTTSFSIGSGLVEGEPHCMIITGQDSNDNFGTQMSLEFIPTYP